MRRMKNVTSKRALVAASALSLVVGAGGAIAASKGSPERGDGFLARVAGHLGISTQRLEDATKAAAIDQVNADLEAGRITKAQADELKARFEKGEAPLLFGGPRLFGLHRFGDFGHAPFGALGGAIGGKFQDIGIDDDFIKQVGASIQPGQSALFLLIHCTALFP